MNDASNIGGTTSAPSDTVLAEVRTAITANAISEAIALSRRALSSGIEHPLLLNLRAFWHEQEGNLAASLADLERARSLAPSDATILHALGLCLGKMAQWEQAISLFDEVIALVPDYAPAHYNKGWNSEFRGDLEVAEKCYEQALALNPVYPEATSRIAALAARRADWAKTKAVAARALALDNTQFLALQSLIRAAMGEKDFDQADQLVVRHLSDGRAGPLDRAIAFGHLGDLRHAQGRYSEAFRAYTDGNALHIQISSPKFRQSNQLSAADYAEWLADYMECARSSDIAADRSSPTTSPSGDPLQHVFLVGSPRSGTTLLENVLVSHPKIVSLEERPLLRSAVEEFLSSEWGLRRLISPRRRELEEQRRLYWESVRRERVEPEGKIFVDKNPLNLLNLAVVAKLFPKAKVLWAVRDPRDVVLSCYRHTFLVNRSMFEYLTLEGTARFYDTLMRIGMTYREKLGLDWYELRNENLIENFEVEARKICDFIGIEWNAEMKNFGQLAKSRYIATPSATQVMRGLNRDGVGQWRHYKDELSTIMPILTPWIERFGYTTD